VAPSPPAAEGLAQLVVGAVGDPATQVAVDLEGAAAHLVGRDPDREGRVLAAQRAAGTIPSRSASATSTAAFTI
jgi:hypothetical protein